jgi:hypothetical protein
VCLLVCLLLATAPSFGGSKPKPGFLKKPGKDFLATPLAVVPPAETCNNWSWAAAAQSILALDKVSVDQHDLIIKVFGGELCVDDGLDLQTLGDAVAGEYVLGPKDKMKVVTRVFPAGAPIAAEDLIAAIRRGRPMLLFWKMHAYVVTGATYDEIIGPNGNRIFQIHVLTLLDPMDPRAEVTFDRDKNDMGELDGAMEFVLFRMKQIDWVPSQ